VQCLRQLIQATDAGVSQVSERWDLDWFTGFHGSPAGRVEPYEKMLQVQPKTKWLFLGKN
jgi:hypothetical protein